jgi:hypothetical protein
MEPTVEPPHFQTLGRRARRSAPARLVEKRTQQLWSPWLCAISWKARHGLVCRWVVSYSYHIHVSRPGIRLKTVMCRPATSMLKWLWPATRTSVKCSSKARVNCKWRSYEQSAHVQLRQREMAHAPAVSLFSCWSAEYERMQRVKSSSSARGNVGETCRGICAAVVAFIHARWSETSRDVLLKAANKYSLRLEI